MEQCGIMLVAAALGAFLASYGGRFLAEFFLERPIPLIGQFASFSLIENRGVAFGIALPPLLQHLLIGGALLIVLVLAWRARHDRVSALGFGLILGGAFANIIDRIGDGLVTDFIRIGSFPTFNIADSGITVGVLLLIGWEAVRGREGRRGR